MKSPLMTSFRKQTSIKKGDPSGSELAKHNIYDN